MKFKDLWCNKFKFIQRSWIGEGLLYVICMEAISVLRMKEKRISIPTEIRTPQSIKDTWMLCNDKED